MIENMSLREKIGQLIVTGFKTPILNESITKLVEDYKIANIILFSYNVESSGQLRNLCFDIQALVKNNTGHPAFITIDQEGGMVTRLPSDATNIPGAMAISSTRNPQNAYIAGAITAAELKALGINFNLAPVMDINSNKSNPVINVRSYGDTKETVCLYATLMMKGLLDNGVLSCIKHFPGHGDTDVDSHLGLPIINKTFSQLQNNELVPFVNAIENGAEAVMTAHILFPAIEKEKLPATMSKTIITDLLKKQLGFRGLVLSDCLEMNAIKENYGTAKGALAAIKAGVNLVFISHTADYVMEAVELIEEAVNTGELSIKIIDQSVQKVLDYKKKYASENMLKFDINTIGSNTHKEAIKKISQQSICLVRSESGKLPEINENSVFIGSYAYRSTMVSSSVDTEFNFAQYMASKFNTNYLITEINPTENEINTIIEKTSTYKTIIFGTYNGYINHGQLELVNKLSMHGHKVVAAALRSPYDLAMVNDKVDAIATFEYTKLAFDSLAEILCGKVNSTGKISVEI